MLETTKKHDGSTNSLQCNLRHGGLIPAYEMKTTEFIFYP